VKDNKLNHFYFKTILASLFTAKYKLNKYRIENFINSNNCNINNNLPSLNIIKVKYWQYVIVLIERVVKFLNYLVSPPGAKGLPHQVINHHQLKDDKNFPLVINHHMLTTDARSSTTIQIYKCLCEEPTK